MTQRTALRPTLTARARGARSSAIRDLLEHARQPGMISLAGGVPDPDCFPLVELQAAAVRALEHPANAQYGLTAGEETVRALLSATVLPVPDPTLCVVTTGSQQALDLISRVMLDPGDSIVVGDPDYLGLIQAARTYGAELTAIPMDADGLDTDTLALRLSAGLRPKICYTVPHFHNPTGAVLTTARRRHLIELAETYGFLVIEDDPYRDLWYDSPPDHQNAGHASPNVVHLRSTSKVLAPGLRLGWMVGPGWLCDAVTIAKQAADLHTSTLSQAIVADCLSAPWFPAHLDTLRATYGTKRDAMMDALDALPASCGLTYSRPTGGMFCWVQIHDCDTATLLQTALDQGVAFVPGPAFSPAGGLESSLRLSFATAGPEDLREGIARLERTINRS